jgi:hypothetical protein
LYLSEVKQAQEATEKANAKVKQAASIMFQLYASLLSNNAKYVWNKIVHKQTQSNPYTDVQGCSKKGPSGYLRKSFYNCMVIHLLTVFPNNTAEQQERYYITNMLKKPQHVSMISLCSVYDCSTPTSHNYHAGSTAPVPSPVKFHEHTIHQG